MLGIGMQEILIILVVALVVIGPKRLPEMARLLGRGFAEFRKATDDLQQSIRLDAEQQRHDDIRKRYASHLPPEEGEGEEEPPRQEDTREAEEEGEAADPPGDAVQEEEPRKGAAAEQEAEEEEDGSHYSPEEIEGGEPDDEPGA